MTGAPPPPPPPPPGGAVPPPPSGFGPPSPSGPPPAAAPRTNGMSIASLVLGLVGIPFCCFVLPSVLAVVFGFVGLGQIKQDPSQRGRGMAIAGLVLGFVMIGLFALVLAFGDTSVQLR